MSKRSKNIPSLVANSRPRRLNLSIEQADNGHVIRASGEGDDGEYNSKTMVSPNNKHALKISNEHLANFLGKSDVKDSGKKLKKKDTKRKIAFVK